ncbi:hypothetical protein [Maribacter algicola]|nr:hypothetical protein [Maribacter algicola]
MENWSQLETSLRTQQYHRREGEPSSGAYLWRMPNFSGEMK